MAKDDRKLVTRSKVLDAALVLFARHGLDGATVGDIASQAAVAHGTVFLHFGSKSGIYAESVRVAAMHFLCSMREAVGHDTASFATVAERWVQDLSGELDWSRLLRSLSGDHCQSAVETAAKCVNRAFEEFWHDWLQRREYASGRQIPRKRERARFVVMALAGVVGTRFDDHPGARCVLQRDLISILERVALGDL